MYIMSMANIEVKQQSSGFNSVSELNDKIKEPFDRFKERLEVFTELKKGDKIMLDAALTEEAGHNVYYALSPGYWQVFQRWWYGESSENTLKYLGIEFDEYTKFLDNILELTRDNYSYYTFEKLMNDICDFSNKLMLGIYKIKETYETHIEICAKTDSIILVLLDFKNDIGRLKNAKKRRHGRIIHNNNRNSKNRKKRRSDKNYKSI